MTVQRTPEQNALLEALGRHLTELDARYGFGKRLARENGWLPDFTNTVVAEYAKFLFIAREGGHSVCPSPAIDKAWHLHLLHTGEYWGDLCPNILRMEFHHSPAEGARNEQDQMTSWHEQTLASYRKFFGDPPRLWQNNPPVKQNQSRRLQAVVIGGVGIGAIVFGSINSVFIYFWFIGLLFVVVGTLLFVSAGGSAFRRGQGNQSSCGSFTCGSNGGHGGHGGHGCGGHGCGGHGCGGGGCGGGGH